MDRETCRRINCPYGAILVPEKKAVALFNREYEPLGFPAFGGIIPDETRLSWFLNVNEIKDVDVNNFLDKLRNFSYCNSVGAAILKEEPFAGCAAYHIFFYNDGCIPTSSSSDLENYFDRVSRFLKFIGKQEMNICMKNMMTKKQRYNYFHRYY